MIGEGGGIDAGEAHVWVSVHGESVFAGEEVCPVFEVLETVVDGEVRTVSFAEAGDVSEDIVHLDVAAREVVSAIARKGRKERLTKT